MGYKYKIFESCQSRITNADGGDIWGPVKILDLRFWAKDSKFHICIPSIANHARFQESSQSLSICSINYTCCGSIPNLWLRNASKQLLPCQAVGLKETLNQSQAAVIKEHWKDHRLRKQKKDKGKTLRYGHYNWLGKGLKGWVGVEPDVSYLICKLWLMMKGANPKEQALSMQKEQRKPKNNLKYCHYRTADTANIEHIIWRLQPYLVSEIFRL